MSMIFNKKGGLSNGEVAVFVLWLQCFIYLW